MNTYSTQYHEHWKKKQLIKNVFRKKQEFIKQSYALRGEIQKYIALSLSLFLSLMLPNGDKSC